ncbi:hypothetical protein Lesp02_02330 [Lentzea sp. NBRC 105346]|uniref:SRPBCC family protein n=1 Tax=Lentzea sp. NBRC 105346 TaxID=3032205 RepID=UPI0024A13E70|nr:SRPBCC family protein [Lentzea sp. NBRC 105346]GLZ28043.1 hypothetical protein Lesp02_02330 [Lentzea sp. NBRC 105346]
MPADAEVVFDVVTDLEYMTTWLPRSIEVELSGPNLVRLWLPGADHDIDLERQVSIDWERLRIDWGIDSTTSYSGSLQVLRLAPDRSAVTVTVEITGAEGVPRCRVEAWVEEALGALETVIAAEPRPPSRPAAGH